MFLDGVSIVWVSIVRVSIVCMSIVWVSIVRVSIVCVSIVRVSIVWVSIVRVSIVCVFIDWVSIVRVSRGRVHIVRLYSATARIDSHSRVGVRLTRHPVLLPDPVSRHIMLNS